MSSTMDPMLDLAVDYWRLLRAFRGLAERAASEHRERALAQLQFAQGRFDRVLGATGVRPVSFDGRAYEPGLPVTVVNAEDQEVDSPLRIAQTLEPAFVSDGRVLRFGKVVVEVGE